MAEDNTTGSRSSSCSELWLPGACFNGCYCSSEACKGPKWRLTPEDGVAFSRHHPSHSLQFTLLLFQQWAAKDSFPSSFFAWVKSVERTTDCAFIRQRKKGYIQPRMKDAAGTSLLFYLHVWRALRQDTQLTQGQREGRRRQFSTTSGSHELNQLPTDKCQPGHSFHVNQVKVQARKTHKTWTPSATEGAGFTAKFGDWEVF